VPPFDPQDDAALGGFMAESGIDGPPERLRTLLSRIAAAPAMEPPDAWVELVAPDAAPETAAVLTRLKAALAPAPPAKDPSRLDALRAALGTRGVDGFVVPRADEHQGEDLPADAERLAWLTGFTGSAGTAVVLADRAALFVDGRYTLQAGHQVDGERWEIVSSVKTPVVDWLGQALSPGARLGYDPRLVSVDQAKRLRAAAEKAGARLVPVEPNPIDDLWVARPPAPLGPVLPHDTGFAGESAEDKRRRIAEDLAARRIDAAVLTQPESIAWLLNLRGRDVPNTPLPLSYAVVHDDRAVELFVDPAKLTRAARRHLGNAVTVAPPAGLERALDRLGDDGRTVLVDPATCNEWVRDRLVRAGAQVTLAEDPCVLPRATKNETEIEGSRRAHLRDGVAMVRFLAWLDRTAPQGTVTEMEAAERLTALRAEGEHWRGISFPPISGAGPNGAIVHYRVTAETDRRLEPGTLYLTDSGGQYLDGTTDITRTVAIGEPDAEMRRCFTLVLRGHIALATARFPEGTAGGQLDALARQFLWKAGLDYDHGTGHGVGAYLGVHEGPARISGRSAVPLRAGMILSNEPGYYRAGAFGIRIENLIVVQPSEQPAEPGRSLLAFETVTLCPIDRRLVDTALMTPDEVAWLDAYHARVRQALSATLGEEDRAWLEAATAPLG